MTTEQLGYILEIHKCQSINKASRNLFVSQPSLSAALKNLEQEIGYKIFERTSTGIRPTEQGQDFLRFAERAHADYLMMCRVPMPNIEDCSLSITSACSSLYSRVYFDFKQAYPAPNTCRDVFREATIFPSLQDLTSHHTRLVVSYLARSQMEKYESYASKHDLNLYVLRDFLPIRVVVGKQHPLAKKEFVDVSEVPQYPFVTYQGIDHEDILGTIGINSAEIQYVSSRATFYDAIRYGGYISTTIAFAKGEEDRTGCLCLPCKNYQDSFVPVAFSQSGGTLSRREKEFIKYLKRRLGEV